MKKRTLEMRICLVCSNDRYCAAKAFYSCPAIISRRPGSQNTSKKITIKFWERFKKKTGQIACNFGEIIIKLQAVWRMSQTKPHPWRHTPPQASALASVLGGSATWRKPGSARITRETEAPRTGAKIRGEGGVIAVISHQWVERNAPNSEWR